MVIKPLANQGHDPCSRLGKRWGSLLWFASLFLGSSMECCRSHIVPVSSCSLHEFHLSFLTLQLCIAAVDKDFSHDTKNPPIGVASTQELSQFACHIVPRLKKVLNPRGERPRQWFLQL